jgi:hypothetical protein
VLSLEFVADALRATKRALDEDYDREARDGVAAKLVSLDCELDVGEAYRDPLEVS